MYSTLPKVLHCLAGRPLLAWVMKAAQTLKPTTIHVIYGHGGEQLQQAFQQDEIHWIHQPEQRGTAHALLQALPFLPESSQVLVLSGDVPLIQPQTLASLLQLSSQSNETTLNLLLTTLPDPTGYGRVIRDAKNAITGIVEQKDATPQQLAIQEIYSGICLAHTADLQRWLPSIQPHNRQQEYYLTDIVKLAHLDHIPILSVATDNSMEVEGINTPRQLVTLERYWQKQQAYQLLSQGVKIMDPERIDIRGTLQAGQDVYIDINTVFEGDVVLGKGCTIGPHCVLNNVAVGEHTHILPHSIITQAHIGNHCTIGPFSHIRPGTTLHDHCKIGNFVETKNAQFDVHSKANHLSYLGDVTIGKEVNIGAGTITCNYDGVNKHQTKIEDGAFIGSGTQLIAPVEVGKGATIGAGTTLREHAPADTLTLSIQETKSIKGWHRPSKKKS